MTVRSKHKRGDPGPRGPSGLVEQNRIDVQQVMYEGYGGGVNGPETN